MFVAVKLLEVAECLHDKKRNDCLVNWDKAGFIDIVEFMRYFRRSPRALQKEGKLELPASEGIPGFKYVLITFEKSVFLRGLH